MIDKFVQQVSEALGNNEIETAIAQLQNLIMMADTELLSDIVLLSARYKKLQSDIRKDVLSYDEETKANNKIVDGLFSLVKEIKSQPDRYAAYFKVEAEMGMAEQKQRVSMSDWQKDVLMDRMSRVKTLHIPFRVLWLDDNPGWSQYEINLLESLGVEVVTALNSADGSERLENEAIDLIISDIRRDGKINEGIVFLGRIADTPLYRPTIFYVGEFEPQLGTPPYAFGITNWPSELLHLVMDAMERKGPASG